MTNPEPQFLIDRENNTITVIREFSAPLSRVWKAYTTASILDQWWAPKPWKTVTKSMDLRAGGHWQYSMVGPGGEQHHCFTEYKEVKHEVSFTGTDGFSDENGNINTDLPQSTWEVSFESLGDRTRVTLQIQYPDLAQLEATVQMGFKEGLLSAMTNLDKIIEG